MNTPTPVISSDSAFACFDLVGFGQVTVPEHPLRFGFQVDIIPSQAPTHLLFGLITRVRDGRFSGRSHGFAVRVDLETGEIWDALNDSGLIGWIHSPETLNRFTDEEPMLLSWEVEHLGNALIPRLQIANEEWLYPTLECRAPMSMDTIAGCLGDQSGGMDVFMHPAVWREQI